MRYLLVLFYAALVLAQGTVTFTGITPLPTGDASTEYKLYGWHTCSTGQKNAILDALAEKTIIMGVDSVLTVKWHHQGAVEYFG